MHLKHFKLLAFGTFFIPQLSVAWAQSGPEIAVGPVVRTSWHRHSGFGAAYFAEAQSHIPPNYRFWLQLYPECRTMAKPARNTEPIVRLGAVPVYLSYYPGERLVQPAGRDAVQRQPRFPTAPIYVENGHNYGDVTGSIAFQYRLTLYRRRLRSAVFRNPFELHW